MRPVKQYAFKEEKNSKHKRYGSFEEIVCLIRMSLPVLEEYLLFKVVCVYLETTTHVLLPTH